MQLLKVTVWVGLLVSASVFARPEVERCLGFAPKTCKLTTASSPDKIYDCMKAQKLNVSVEGERACNQELRHYETHLACDKADVPKFCAGVKPGHGQLMGCLRSHRAELSVDCRETLNRLDVLKVEAKPAAPGTLESHPPGWAAPEGAGC